MLTPRETSKRVSRISQARADQMMSVMKKRCNILNIVHAVGMGSSKMLNDQDLEKQRIVEVWAVIP